MSLTVTARVPSQVEDSVNPLCPPVVLFVLNASMHIYTVCHDAMHLLLKKKKKKIFIWGKKQRIEEAETHEHSHRHTDTNVLCLKVQRLHFLLFPPSPVLLDLNVSLCSDSFT